VPDLTAVSLSHHASIPTANRHTHVGCVQQRTYSIPERLQTTSPVDPTVGDSRSHTNVLTRLAPTRDGRGDGRSLPMQTHDLGLPANRRAGAPVRFDRGVMFSVECMRPVANGKQKCDAPRVAFGSRWTHAPALRSTAIIARE
jgi:hypothetical protein